MSLLYKKHMCYNCDKEQAGTASVFQWVLLIFFLCLFVVPGVVYYFFAKPSRCYICGLRKRHKNEDKPEK